MVAGVMTRNGALTQDRADQQQLGFPPGWARKQRCEGNEQGYNGIGQGEHGWAFPLKVGSGQLPVFILFLNYA